jgi:hypothetical protein
MKESKSPSVIVSSAGSRNPANGDRLASRHHENDLSGLTCPASVDASSERVRIGVSDSVWTLTPRYRIP